MTESDADLLSRSAAGDRQAFTTFVGRHQAAVYRYLLQVSREPADAEDALQEGFLAAWRHAGGYRGGESATGWLFTIARHALYRHRRRRAGEPDDFVPLEDLGRRAGWGEPATKDTGLEGLARRELIERALASLPEAERETVLLRDVEALPGETVAALTGVSLAAMKSRLHRGRLRLAGALEELRHG